MNKHGVKDVTKTEDKNNITIEFVYNKKTYKISCTRAAAYSQKDNRTVQVFTEKELKDLRFDQDIIKQFFVAATEVNGVVKEFALKAGVTLQRVKYAQTQKLKDMQLLTNFLADKNKSSDNVKDLTGKNINTSNYSRYADAIKKATNNEELEEIQKEALDKFVKDFASGNVAIDNVKTILNAIGVEDLIIAENQVNNKYVVSFKFADKTYNLFCNKDAAKSGADNITANETYVEKESINGADIITTYDKDGKIIDKKVDVKNLDELINDMITETESLTDEKAKLYDEMNSCTDLSKLKVLKKSLEVVVDKLNNIVLQLTGLLNSILYSSDFESIGKGLNETDPNKTETATQAFSTDNINKLKEIFDKLGVDTSQMFTDQSLSNEESVEKNKQPLLSCITSALKDLMLDMDILVMKFVNLQKGMNEQVMSTEEYEKLKESIDAQEKNIEASEKDALMAELEESIGKFEADPSVDHMKEVIELLDSLGISYTLTEDDENIYLEATIDGTSEAQQTRGGMAATYAGLLSLTMRKSDANVNIESLTKDSKYALQRETDELYKEYLESTNKEDKNYSKMNEQEQYAFIKNLIKDLNSLISIILKMIQSDSPIDKETSSQYSAIFGSIMAKLRDTVPSSATTADYIINDDINNKNDKIAQIEEEFDKIMELLKQNIEKNNPTFSKAPALHQPESVEQELTNLLSSIMSLL